ncbi:MAG: UDP-N-acetylmuramate dehydrogenase [Bdellovibrionales bacterium]
MEIQKNVPLHDYAWWKIGGPADWFCAPTSIEEVKQAYDFARENNLKVTILGGATNVLISDQGIEGLTISTRGLRGTSVAEREGRVVIEAWAGTPKSELTKIFLQRRLAPALFLCGLPGDVGGGIVMNAGVGEAIRPREFVELVDWVEVLDSQSLQIRQFQRDELHWEYRHSSGWQPGMVVRAGLSWPSEPEPDISRRVTEATKNRRTRQPLELPSCGSTFKNPPNGKSGALIEQAGLKGLQVGQAQVSTKHANFIVNLGGARAADVDQIIRTVQDTVEKKSGVKLECEVRYLGRW